MSIDLGQLFTAAGPLVASAIRSSGTTVDLLRDARRDSGTHPGTLTVSDPTPPELVATDQPALVTALTLSADYWESPGVQVRTDAYKVLLLADVQDVRPGDLVRVTASRDPKLVGRHLVVRRVITEAAGVVRALDTDAAPLR